MVNLTTPLLKKEEATLRTLVSIEHEWPSKPHERYPQFSLRVTAWEDSEFQVTLNLFGYAEFPLTTPKRNRTVTKYDDSLSIATSFFSQEKGELLGQANPALGHSRPKLTVYVPVDRGGVTPPGRVRSGERQERASDRTL